MWAYPHARGPRAEQMGHGKSRPPNPHRAPGAGDDEAESFKLAAILRVALTGRPGAGDDEAAQAPLSTQVALGFLLSFSAVAVGLGAARAATTSYFPVLLEEIAQQRPGLIGLAMLSNALAGFFVPLAVGLWADRIQVGAR